MKRIIRTILAVIFIAVITFSAVSIVLNLGRGLKADVTEQDLYTLSEGTESIINKLNQPFTMKLYYTKTAARKAPDQIRFFNKYYNYVHSLLEEYAAVSDGMIKLEIIDPRPFSDEEVQAMQYGLQRIPMGEEESFFFGLVAQTQFGKVKTIPFFSPERQNFVEYDISELIDSAIRREKKTMGVLSSLPVTGQDVSGYMAQMMRMQGQQPQQPWGIIETLKEKYEIKKIETDVNSINDVDILMVVHPKDLPENTLFAIDQFVLNGGRTIVCVDPHCLADRPKQRQMQMMGGHKSSSNLNRLLNKWGLDMPENTFAGDMAQALTASLRPQARPQKIIGFLGIGPEEVNQDSVITANLDQVRMLFAGVLKEKDISDSNDAPEIERIPLISTTGRGNEWSATSKYQLMMPDAGRLMENFVEGTEPVHMGYLVSGKFESAFPEGVTVENESDPNSEPVHLEGLKKASETCLVTVYSDVDFISDMLAYQDSFFGRTSVGDNSTLIQNTVDELTGSPELISIRSRGRIARPFTVVDRIEQEAEKGTLEEEKKIKAEIEKFESELNQILATAEEGKEDVIGSDILQKKRELELKIHEAQMRLRDLKMQKREKIEQLGNILRNLNTIPGPAIMILIAVVLGIYRATKKRYYISHASDA